MTTVKIGYDRRCWATFELKDASPLELAALRRAFETGSDADTDVAKEILSKMQSDERLAFTCEDQDPSPDYFADYAEPLVVDLECEET